MTTPMPSPLTAKAIARLAALRHVGELTEADASSRSLKLVVTDHGAASAPDHINLTLLVDNAGIVKDARFRSPAKDGMLAAYDLITEQAIGRTLEDAARFTPRQADTQLRDANGGAVLDVVATNHPDADQPFYVLRKALERFQGAKAVTDAVLPAGAGVAATLPWMDVGLFEKVRRIEAVLDTHVRPALASDGGGLDLVDDLVDVLASSRQIRPLRIAAEEQRRFGVRVECRRLWRACAERERQRDGGECARRSWLKHRVSRFEARA